MGNRTVISVENLGKSYRISHQGERQRYVALRDVIAEKFRGLFRPRNLRAGARSSTEDFWALKNVSFEVKQGDVVGIIGRNGAGKSTLLKILSRITEPTEGRVRIKGRVASLLEVGTGFHPELTGRENIYLNGAILGMSRVEIKKKFDEIVAFAEVEKFLDTPVKRYSSGMYVRLAFAVAAHLEPEILIVDEVLAVGDAEFQKRCLGKMRDVSTKEGRTVLFVSHSMQSISTLTQFSLLLSHGRGITFGPTKDVIRQYLHGLSSGDMVYKSDPSREAPKITRVEVETSEPANRQICGKPLVVRFTVDTPYAVRGLCLSFQVLNSSEEPVIHLWSFDSERPMGREAGQFELIAEIPNLRLYMGQYTLKTYLSEPPGGRLFECLNGICRFEVVMYNCVREFSWQPGTCVYLEDAKWNVGKKISHEVS